MKYFIIILTIIFFQKNSCADDFHSSLTIEIGDKVYSSDYLGKLDKNITNEKKFVLNTIFPKINDDGLQGVSLFNFLALEYKDINQSDKAILILEKGLQFYDSYKLNYNLADLYLKNNQYNKAKSVLIKAKRIKSASINILINTSTGEIIYPEKYQKENFHKNMSKEELSIIFKELIELYEEFYLICTQCERVNNFYGNILYHSHDYYKSMVAFDREIKINEYDYDSMKSFSELMQLFVLEKLKLNKSKLDCYLTQKVAIKEISQELELMKSMKFKQRIKSLLEIIETMEFLIKFNEKSLFSIDNCFNSTNNNFDKLLECVEYNQISYFIDIIDSNTNLKIPNSMQDIKKLLNQKVLLLDNDIGLQYFINFIQDFSKYNLPYINACEE